MEEEGGLLVGHQMGRTCRGIEQRGRGEGGEGGGSSVGRCGEDISRKGERFAGRGADRGLDQSPPR